MKRTIILLFSLILFGCVSLAVKDYNPLEKEGIIPDRDQIELKYSQNISKSWETEVTLGPEAESVNVGFIYRPDNSQNISYVNQTIDELYEIVSKKGLAEKLDTNNINISNLWANIYSIDLTNMPVSFRWRYKNQPSVYALNVLSKRLYWHLSMQILNESHSATLNTQWNFFISPEQQRMQQLKERITLFPYLTASHLEATTNALEYTELLSRPVVWENR